MLCNTFQDRALDWYIRYVQSKPNASLDQIKDALKEQFKKPKSYARLVSEMNEVHQEVNEYVLEADQRLKCTIRYVIFIIDDTQHKE